MDSKKYLSLFLQEVRENCTALSAGLVELEKHPSNTDLLQELMRLSHGCKGGCATMEFEQTADLCHTLEDVFDAARTGTLLMNSDIIDVCLEAVDAVEDSLKKVEKEGQEMTNFEVILELNAIAQQESPSDPKPSDHQTIKSSNPSTKPPNTEEASIHEEISHIRVDTKKLDQLLDLAGEFSLLKMHVARLAQDPTMQSVLTPVIDQLTKLTDQLTYSVTESRLVPLEQVFARFPRLVRDLAKEQKKQITFTMEGVDINLDKTLVDHLSTPLIHLLRNAVDHGIVTEGTITLSVTRAQGYAIVSVEDNGPPIDWQKIKEIALQRGFDPSEIAQVDDNTLMAVLCDPRFSSSGKVTAVSGRGVGLSAVLQTAKSLGGQFALTQENGVKRFTIALPLQLSIIRALLVESNDNVYALPFVHVKRLLELEPRAVKSAMGTKAAVIDGEDVPLIFLQSILSPQSPTFRAKNQESRIKNHHVVLTEYESGTVGFIVDRISGNEEIMVKPLSAAIRKEEHFTGSTILGDGTVGLILDIPSLVRHCKTRTNDELKIEN